MQGVRCVKLDGGMTVAARDRAIDAFREDPFVTVFLISLKAGGVALNLTPASRIFLMDCWYGFLFLFLWFPFITLCFLPVSLRSLQVECRC